MKIIMYFLSLIILNACSKDDSSKKDHHTDSIASFKVKVEASFCAYTILSVQDSAFYNKGMKWKEYDHVFSVSNPCDRPDYLKIGEIYTCKIIDKPKKTDCIVCMGFMETPPLDRNVLLFR